MAKLKQCIRRVRPNKAGTSCDQKYFLRTFVLHGVNLSKIIWNLVVTLLLD